MRKILVLEDNVDINEIITNILNDQGYTVYSSFDAFHALKVFNTEEIDCVITDLMLPLMSGEQFISEIRKRSNVHIIIISAKVDTSSKLEGLRIGADDYLYKPFLEEELILKVDNLFKKKQKEETLSFNHHEVLFEIGKPTISVLNNDISLTSVEYRLLKILIESKGKVITRDVFLDTLYSYGDEVFDRVIDVHIGNIRKKIKHVYKKELIKTVYGLGYQFVGEKDE